MPAISAFLHAISSTVYILMGYNKLPVFRGFLLFGLCFISLKALEKIANRNAQDSRQLVRTQSLGSVGAQTVDSVWRSDDNSSCGSDAHSINEINLAARKQKQKEWFETSLDGPAPSTPTRSHSVMSSTLQSSIASISPEEKYMEMNPHKSPLEIPSESKRQPSPTVHEPNMELFNNNIPKHGTLIQAGQCKPYHEETKPCEMDRHHWHNVGNLNETFVEENPNAVQKVIYQPLQAMTCQPFSPNKKHFQKRYY